MSTVKSVIIVSDSAAVDGGAAKVAIETARLMSEQGLDVALFAGGSDVAPGLTGRVDVELSGHGAMATGRRHVTAALRGIWDGQVGRQFEEFLDKFDPAETVVHFHSWGSRLSPAVFSAVRRRGMASVITAHDYLLACPNSCLYQFPTQEICDVTPGSLACALTNCDRVDARVKAFRLARFAAQRVALRRLRPDVVYVSQFQSDRVDASIPFEHVSQVISNPIDVPNRTQEYTGADGPVICTGRMEKEKAMDLFCRSAQLAGTDAVVVGSGSERERLVEQHPTVEFIEWLPSSELYAKMLQSKALVFPSRWYEAAPLTPLEAQLVAALPCIISDACAARDVIEDGVTGLVFRSGDEADLARCLLQLSDPETHARMRSNILDRYPVIRRRYAAETYVAAMRGAYHAALNSRAGANAAEQLEA
jgi:glycosyltransferase involved in cell wall biosynthesis